MITTHYDVLGVPAGASSEEIRAAYRDRARQLHPDRGGDTSESMVAINAAYHVLADPGRRAVYDRSLRSAPVPSVDDVAPDEFEYLVPDRPNPLSPSGPARVPWKLMVGAAVIGSIAVLVSSMFDDPPKQPAPDGVLRAGSCVAFEPNGDAREVACGSGEGNDVVVQVLVPLDGTCPTGTVGHRDRLGLGIACVST